MPNIGLDQFHGRESILKLLSHRTLGLKEGYRQNMAFLGERFIGKSLIVHKFLSDWDDKAIVPVYLDLENKEFPYLFQKLAGSLLYAYNRDQQLPLHEDVTLLMKAAQSHLPQTTAMILKIKGLMHSGKLEEAYSELLALPQLFATESGRYCFLILDEFHHLDQLGVPDAFQELGKTIMTQKRCLYLVISSSPHPAEKILSEKLSLLFGNFEVINIESFDLKASQEFIERQLGDCRIKEGLSGFLVDFTGGHPLYLQLICQEIKSLCATHRQLVVYQPLFIQAIHNILFHPWGVLGRHFELLMMQLCAGKGNGPVSAILMALADRRSKVKDLAERLDTKNSLLMPRIHRLIESGVVVKNGQFYYLKDKLLKYWIKYIYQFRHHAWNIYGNVSGENFVKDFARVIDSFITNAAKDLPTRIMELLYCFEDDAVVVGGRKYKLPLFQEIIPVKIRKVAGDYFDVIKASSSQGDWFIVIKLSAVTESDVHLILAEARKLDNRPQRCVLISLDELDDTAKLKALQERMWIWSEREIKTLSSIFDKPYIYHLTECDENRGRI
jgi:hypothetical protein